MSSNKVLCSILLVLAFSSASIANAQIRAATITGSVKDATGGAIVGADVIVTNQETNIANHSKTTEAGQFTVPYLAAGTYTVAVTAAGFAPYKETAIAVATGQSVRTDVSLKVGSVESAIEVKAEAAQIQTDSSSVQAGVRAEVIAAIPNITQNPFYYVTLQAGVVSRNKMADTMGANSFGIGYEGRNAFSAFSVNGGNAFMNDIQMDGLSMQGGAKNDAMLVPNTEGLQEVRVISNNFSAEYGRGHGVISMNTKSGTNQYHGSATYRLRNEALNANSNSNNANGIKRGAFKVHEFGGGIGGPIKKDKLFFFSSYHHLIHNRAVDWLLTVPTELEKKGDFSKSFVRDPSGAALPAQIFDPWTVSQLGPDLYRRAAYPNAVIPNPDKYGLKMMSYYPGPNRTPDDAFNTNNFGVRTIRSFRRDSSNNRIDYQKGKHSIYGSGGISYGTINTGRPWGASSPFMTSGSDLESDKNEYAQIGDTVILSPSLVLDVRFGLARLNMKRFGSDRSGFADYDAIGVPKSIQAVMPIPGAAPLIFTAWPGGSGGAYSAMGGSYFVSKHERQTMYNWVGSVTKIRGRWTLKAGAEFRNLLSNYQDLEEASVSIGNPYWVGGNYTFEYLNATGGSVSQNVNAPQNGFSGAGILTGAGHWWVRPGQSVMPALGQRYYAIYSQNDWRATSKLTINLGLRWDFQPGPTERYNRMAALDLEAKNAWGTQGTLAFAGAGGNSRHLWDTRYRDFGPRVGAAYQLSSTIVLRGGFGISYLPSNTGYFDGPTLYGASAFGQGTDRAPYGPNPQGVPIGRFSEVGPTTVVQPVGALNTDPRVYGSGETLFNRRAHEDGRTAQWNFFVEKKFSNLGLVSAGYSASKSTHLEYSYGSLQNLQNLPPATLAGWRDQYIASNGTLNPATQQIPNPYQPAQGARLPFQGELANATIRRQVPLLPYPILIGLGPDFSTGFADYQSLQLRLTRGFSSGLHIDTHYTWSKTLDTVNTAAADAQGINNGGGATSPDILNLRNNRRYSFNDVPHRFVLTAVYDLPFGTGRPLEVPNRVVRAIIGKWQMGGVVTAYSGSPFGASGASDGAALGRPDRIAGAAVEVPLELQHWYDGRTTVTLPSGRKVTPSKNTFLKYSSDAYRGRVVGTPNGGFSPDVYWWGTAAPTYGDLRGPGRFNLDVSLRRVFRIRESMNLEFAADVTNLLNNTQYSGNYSGGLGSTNLVVNSAKGLIPGMGTSDSYGTLGVGAFDPRQVVFNLRLRF